MNIKDLQTYLRSKDVDFSEIIESEGIISILIEWGDWKHSHAYCDYIMSELGYLLIEEYIVEENGDDSYSSMHFYSK